MGTGSGAHIRQELLSSSSTMQPKAWLGCNPLCSASPFRGCSCSFLQTRSYEPSASIAINWKANENFARQRGGPPLRRLVSREKPYSLYRNAYALIIEKLSLAWLQQGQRRSACFPFFFSDSVREFCSIVH